MKNQKLTAYNQNKPKYVNKGSRWWTRHIQDKHALLVLRFLVAEALSKSQDWPEEDYYWAVINPTNKEIFESLSTNPKSKDDCLWTNYNTAKRPIQKSIKLLEESGLIYVSPHKTKSPRYILVAAAIGADLGNIWVTFGAHLGNIWVRFGAHLGYEKSNIQPETRPKRVSNVIQYNTKEVVSTNNSQKESFVEPQKSNNDEVKSIEVSGKSSVFSAEDKNYNLVSKDKSMVQLWEMNRSNIPNPWPVEKINALHDFLQVLSEKWGYQGGLDNDKLNLENWINSPAHKELVAPWLHESIHYTDFRDMPSLKMPNTFKEYGWSPLASERINRIMLPGAESTRELALSTYSMYAQPFNNPYLSPEKKGLAFIRLYPFGFPVRDTWIHPWSPPLIPWAVVADDKDLLEKWNKRYWHSGFHPFQQDKTTARIRMAIAVGNKETPDDTFFDESRYKSLDTKPNIAGARTSIIADPGPFHLLYWYCGTLGISPTLMIDAYKRFEMYNGAFKGLNLSDPSNANVDKIRMFATYLKTYSWGDEKKGSWLPREQGANNSLASGQNQEWFHQGVLGGASVLVRCHDGNSREVWMTNYQKAIYDLKFNPKSEKDKEILDSLLAELL